MVIWVRDNYKQKIAGGGEEKRNAFLWLSIKKALRLRND
jgi:hypothetical protein